jgi:molybdopterin-binding protein
MKSGSGADYPRIASGLLDTQRSNTMTIKAINVRNQFKGNIKEIVLGDVLSEIDVQTASGIVTSVITTRSVRELDLKVGSEVIAFVKSTEVSIAKL